MGFTVESIPVWRRYIVAVAVLLVGAAAAAAARPEWFVAPTGRIPLLGGPLGAALLAVGLWYRVRVVYGVTLIAVGLWVGVAWERFRDGAVGLPAAQLALVIAMLAALVLLIAPPAMRREFLARAA